jgi:hypothetical protein
MQSNIFSPFPLAFECCLGMFVVIMLSPALAIQTFMVIADLLIASVHLSFCDICERIRTFWYYILVILQQSCINESKYVSTYCSQQARGVQAPS